MIKKNPKIKEKKNRQQFSTAGDGGIRCLEMTETCFMLDPSCLFFKLPLFCFVFVFVFYDPLGFFFSCRCAFKNAVKTQKVKGRGSAHSLFLAQCLLFIYFFHFLCLCFHSLLFYSFCSLCWRFNDFVSNFCYFFIFLCYFLLSVLLLFLFLIRSWRPPAPDRWRQCPFLGSVEV